MNASHILKLMNRTPFEPFEIRMNDGGRVMVEHPWQIATAPNSASCAAYEPDDVARLIAYRNITEIVTATPV
jgi:hypothetical protein